MLLFLILVGIALFFSAKNGEEKQREEREDDLARLSFNPARETELITRGPTPEEWDYVFGVFESIPEVKAEKDRIDAIFKMDRYDVVAGKTATWHLTIRPKEEALEAVRREHGSGSWVYERSLKDTTFETQEYAWLFNQDVVIKVLLARDGLVEGLTRSLGWFTLWNTYSTNRNRVMSGAAQKAMGRWIQDQLRAHGLKVQLVYKIENGSQARFGEFWFKVRGFDYYKDAQSL